MIRGVLVGGEGYQNNISMVNVFSETDSRLDGLNSIYCIVRNMVKIDIFYSTIENKLFLHN